MPLATFTPSDLCLSVFSLAPFRSTKAAVKLHPLLDLRGNIPTFIHISDGKMHEVNILDQLLPEPGAFYIMVSRIAICSAAALTLLWRGARATLALLSCGLLLLGAARPRRRDLI